MTTSNAQDLETSKATAAAIQPQTPRKSVATAPKPRIGHKPPNKTARANKFSKDRPETAIARAGTKAYRLLELLQRPGGATMKKLMKITGWQPHSVRGFLSGSVAKKMGLKVTSKKDESGERTYSVKA